MGASAKIPTTPARLARAWLESFCAPDLESMSTLLVPDLRFTGPLLACNNADDYLSALRRDPPTRARHRMIALAESGDCALMFYEYIRQDGAIEIAQLTRVRGGRICEIRLVFDTAELRSPGADPGRSAH